MTDPLGGETPEQEADPMKKLREALERIANEHPNPHDARWIRGASSAIEALRRRAEQAEAELSALRAQQTERDQQLADILTSPCRQCGEIQCFGRCEKT